MARENLSAIAFDLAQVVCDMGEEVIIQTPLGDYTTYMAVSLSAKQMFTFNSRTKIFTGDIVLPENIPYHQISGCYLKKKQNHNHIYLIEECIPNPIDSSILATIKLDQCNEKVDILDTKGTFLYSAWAFYQQQTQQLEQTVDGNLSRSVIDIVFPAKYNISEQYQIRTKTFIDSTVKQNIYIVDEVNMSLLDWTDFETLDKIYGSIACKLRYYARYNENENIGLRL